MHNTIRVESSATKRQNKLHGLLQCIKLVSKKIICFHYITIQIKILNKDKVLTSTSKIDGPQFINNNKYNSSLGTVIVKITRQ